MSKLIIAPEAVADVQDIWLYIGQRDIAAADRLESDISGAFAKLAQHPGLGHRRADLTSKDVLFWSVRKVYLVVYRLASEEVEIVHVFHGARDIAAELATE